MVFDDSAEAGGFGAIQHSHRIAYGLSMNQSAFGIAEDMASLVSEADLWMAAAFHPWNMAYCSSRVKYSQFRSGGRSSDSQSRLMS